MKRIGCLEHRRKGGSHLGISRQTADGKTLTTTLVLGKREIHRIALSRMLGSLEIDLDTFRKHL